MSIIQDDDNPISVLVALIIVVAIFVIIALGS